MIKVQGGLFYVIRMEEHLPHEVTQIVSEVSKVVPGKNLGYMHIMILAMQLQIH